MDATADGGGLAAAGLVLLIAPLLVLAAAVSVLAGAGSCEPGLSPSTPASADAQRQIPAGYLTLYRQAGAAYRVPWTVLAAIGAIESDHGRSRRPGVAGGVNAFGCCAGPMQFNIRNGPPSTWQAYRVDGDQDGDTDVYDPADAIASAANYLKALLEQSRGDLASAVYGYNHDDAYVADVLARARTFSATPEAVLAAPAVAAPCAAVSGGGAADLRQAERRHEPRAFALLPAWAMEAGRAPQPIDARLLDDALWLLRTYGLRVTAAREGGHRTHGDGTALDLIPARPADQMAWDESAGALARDLGWTRACGASGVRPSCPLVPAMQFVGYEGYPGHGSPATCRTPCLAHLHISWASPCYGTSPLSAPCAWVRSFGRVADDRARRPASQPEGP